MDKREIISYTSHKYLTRITNDFSFSSTVFVSPLYPLLRCSIIALAAVRQGKIAGKIMNEYNISTHSSVISLHY